MFQLTVDRNTADVPPLRLLAKEQPATELLAEAIFQWLKHVPEFSQLQIEQGADWIQVRFYFNCEPFCLHYEHYSDCYWIDADSQASLVILSQLATLITSIEYNHGLSLPSSE